MQIISLQITSFYCWASWVICVLLHTLWAHSYYTTAEIALFGYAWNFCIQGQWQRVKRGRNNSRWQRSWAKPEFGATKWQNPCKRLLTWQKDTNLLVNIIFPDLKLNFKVQFWVKQLTDRKLTDNNFDDCLSYKNTKHVLVPVYDLLFLSLSLVEGTLGFRKLWLLNTFHCSDIL